MTAKGLEYNIGFGYDENICDVGLALVIPSLTVGACTVGFDWGFD